MAGFLAEKGQQVLRNGYNVIPIKPGTKAPMIGDAQTVKTTPAQIRKWLSNGHRDDGIGITTRWTPLVDIDVYNADVALEMENWVHLHIGLASVRIGNAPKRGLLFRAETPFTKVRSRDYVDDQGREVHVEILAAGQQFVAYAIHPDTHRPYMWPGKHSGPEFELASDLPTITQEQARAVVAEFERIATERGWPVQQKASTRPGAATINDDDFGLGTDPIGLSEDEIRDKLMVIPNDDRFAARDDWLDIGFGVQHETGKSEFGKELFHEWSRQHHSHSEALFEKAWNSFGKNEYGRRSVTFRYILKLAKEYEQKEITEQFADILARMDLAKDLGELKAAAADAKKLNLDLMDRGRLIVSLQRSAKHFNVTVGIKDARDLVRYEPNETPNWLKGWIYLSHADRFFNTDTKQMLTERSFENTYSEFTGDSSPSDIALRKVRIERAYMAGYLPTAEQFYTLNGNRFANTYSERNSPAVPARLEGQDRANVQRVYKHFEHLFPDPREREVAISWYAYIVQTKKRPNWAVMMQGVDGDGRTFFGNMMAAVLGGENVRTINAKTLEERFTGWAAGQLFTLIEEVRMVGHNRHDIINSIKPYITNATIEIRDMYIPAYNTLNTTAYMLTTNFQNALPLNDNDRRYFILMSQWQDAERLKGFLNENPDYFDLLFATLDESAGAIKGWLMAYKFHPEFNPLGRAPATYGKDMMVEQNRSPESLAIDELVEGGKYAEISRDLIIMSKLKEVMSEEGQMLLEQQIVTALRSGGYTYIGRPRIAGVKVGAWSKRPEKFGRDITTVFARIRTILEKPLL